jgi:competence protein ComEA
MATQAPTPWRVLESPPLDGDEAGPPAPGRHTEGSPPRASLVPRVLAITAAAVVCAIVAFVLAVGGSNGTVDVGAGSDLAAATDRGVSSRDPATTTGDLVVEIVGAVRQPGVYRLPAGSRVGDVLTAAGGYGPRVDTARAAQDLNLAAPVSDGAQVRVPSRDDFTDPDTGSGGAAASGTRPSSGAKVDLNRATQAELEALPGIGPATAQKILEYREQHGGFKSVDELDQVSGIGEKRLAALRDHVRV